MWGNLSPLTEGLSISPLGLGVNKRPQKGGGLLPSMRFSQSGMNWSLSWVIISKESFSWHTQWESLKPLKMLRGGNSLMSRVRLFLYCRRHGPCLGNADLTSLAAWGPTPPPCPKKKKKEGDQRTQNSRWCISKTHRQWLFAHRQAHHSPALFRSGRNP